MRRIQNDTTSTSQAVRNLATNPELVAAVSDKVLRTNLITNPSFETAGVDQAIRTNLVTNPSFEAAGAATTLRTNLVQNPSFEATSGTVAVRNNLITHPSFELNSGTVMNQRINLFNGTVTALGAGATLANDVPFRGNQWSRVSATAAGHGVRAYANLADLVNGQTYAIEWEVANDGATAVSVALDWCDGGFVSFTIEPNQRRRVKASAATVTYTDVYRFGDLTLNAANTNILFREILIEKDAIKGPYFNGATTLSSYDYARGKTVTASNAYTSDFSRFTDGGTDTGVYTQIADGLNGWLQVDLGSVTMIDTLKVWHYYWDGRTYNGTKTEVSVDGVTWTTIYNSAVSGTYVETSAGKIFSFAAQGVRYIRDWLNGSSSNAGNHWVDLQAYNLSASEYTFGWFGGPNTSTSYVKVNAVAGWAQLGTMHHSTTAPMVGSYCGALSTNGANGDGFWPGVDVSVVGGKPYTYSLWVRPTSAHALTFGFRWKDAAGAAAGADTNVSVSAQLSVGKWTRVSGTAIAPASATKLQMLARIYEIHTPTLMYVDGALLTESGADTTYFDGSTPSGNDFTYAWSGIVNASTSVQQAPSLSNWTARWYGNSGGAGMLYQTSNGIKGKAARKLWTVANTTAPVDTGIATSDIPVVANNTYTFSAHVRPSIAQYHTPFVIWKDSVGADITNTASATTPISTPANLWTRVATTVTAPANAVNAVFVVGPHNSSSPMPAGAYLDFDNALVEQGGAIQPYFDGTNVIGNMATDNPNLEVDLGGWATNDGTKYPLVRSTASPIRGTASAVVTRSSTSPDTVVASIWVNGLRPTSITAFKVYPGQVLSFSLDVRPTSGNRNANTYIAFRDSSGVSLGSFGTTTTALTNGVATRVGTANVIVPANADSALFVVNVISSDASIVPANETVTFDGLLIENRSSVSPYYYEGTGDYTFAWSGTADASTSTQRATPAVGVDQVPSLGYAIQSTLAGVTLGTKSLRIIPSHPTNTDSFAELGGLFTGYSWKANTTYTMAADRTIVAPLAGTPSGQLVRVNIGSELTPTTVVGATNVAGTQRVVVRFTTGPATNFAFIRWYAGSTYGNGDVWYDRFTLEEGVTDGSYFDGSTPAYRNLITNSDAETDLTGWVARSQVYIESTTSLKISGIKSVLATATGTSTSVVPGNGYDVGQWSAVQGGKTYTAAVDVKALDSVGSIVTVIDWFSNQGYISASYGATISTPLNTVVRPTATGTAPSNATKAQIFILYTGHAGTGSRLVLDSSLMELGPTTGNYYKGSGDLTYVWAGTANASMSTARAMSAATMSSALSVFQSTEWATRPGTKSLRIMPNSVTYDTFSSVNGDTGALRLGMQAGKTYTAMAKIRLAAPLSGATNGTRWGRIVPFVKSPTVNNGNYVEYPSNGPTNAAGVYTLKTTFTLPADATEAFIRLYNGSSGGSGSVWYDDFILVEGVYNGEYFDGSTPAAGDFTYAWTGTADASTATQRAWNIAGTHNAMRCLMYSTSVNPFSGASMAKGVVSEVGYLPRYELTFPVKRGVRYTAMVKMRASAGPVVVNMKWVATPDTHAPIPFEVASNGNWATVKATSISPSNADTLTLWIGVPSNTALGTEFEIDQIMLVADEYNGPFGNGDSYGWTWEGTPHASVSKGYPVGLRQLAGPPLFIGSTPGQYVLTNVNANMNPVLSPTAPRTIYTIVENLGDIPSGSLDAVFVYGVDSLTDTVPNTTIILRQQSMVGDVNSVLTRRTNGGGPTSLNIPISGKVILISGMNENSLLISGINKSALVVDTPSAVMNVPHERIRIEADTVYHKHIATYIYPGIHSSAVRQEMVKLLAHEYAIPGM